jgi:heme-degrading monooxygenase HmoA
VTIYLSMQRVRFSSPDSYEKFKVVFSDTRHHLMQLPGFIHLTWWQHPDDPAWFNECSFWASKEALYDWHMDTYHKYAKAWAANGAIMEDIITNFELVGTRLLRICPTCGELQDKAYDLRSEQAVLREQCPKCGFHFPYMTEKPSSFAVFKDLVITPPEDSSNGAVKNLESVDDLPSIPN